MKFFHILPKTASHIDMHELIGFSVIATAVLAFNLAIFPHESIRLALGRGVHGWSSRVTQICFWLLVLGFINGIIVIVRLNLGNKR